MIVLLAAAVAAPCRADSPLETFEAHVEQVIRVLRSPDSAASSERRRQFDELKRIALSAVDFEEFSLRTLGVRGRQYPREARAAYVELMTEFLTAFYLRELQERYADEKVIITGQSRVGDDLAVVHATVELEVMTVPVDVFMIRRGNRWRAYDAAAFGISAIGNYRAQVGELLTNDDLASLNRLLERKIASERKKWE
ncbi:MAG: MlaC/ttg2D family ABC transporter substrate-binding protein [Desulfobacterales bacterium]